MGVGGRERERTIDHRNAVFHTAPSQPPPPSLHPSSLPHPLSTPICHPPTTATLHTPIYKQQSSTQFRLRNLSAWAPLELHSQSPLPHAPFCARETRFCGGKTMHTQSCNLYSSYVCGDLFSAERDQSCVMLLRLLPLRASCSVFSHVTS